MLQTSFLRREVAREVPVERIIAAAGFMMKQLKGIPDDEGYSPPLNEIANWIDSLNAMQLLKLRHMADKLPEPERSISFDDRRVG
jgi:hypothetical protein